MPRVSFADASSGATERGIAGRFFYLREAAGPVRVVAVLEGGRRNAYTLHEREQVEFEAPVVELEFSNRHGAAQTIDYEVGFGQFLPANDGQSVVVESFGESLQVETDPLKPLDVKTNPANPLDVAVSGPVEVFTDPAAPLDVKPVQVEPGVAPIEVVTDPAAPLDVKPVQVEPGANPLDVSGATVTVQQAFVVDTEEQIAEFLTPGAEVTLNSAGNIAANLARVELHIKAPLTNAGVVWLSNAAGSGIALDPGEKITLVTTAAVNLLAASAGDKIQFMETAR